MMISAGGGSAGQEGFGLKGMIILSFLVHFLVLAILILSPSLPAPTLTFGPVYSVQLVNMPASLPQRKGPDTSLKELLNIAPDSQPLVRKESASSAPAVPIAPVETRKKSDDNLDTALERIRTNVQSAAKIPKTPAPAATPKGAEQVTPAQPAPPGRQGDGDLSAKMNNYYGLIWLRIKGAWTIPQGMLPQGNVETVIHARIARDGTVTNVGFEKKSGNRYFDESALRSVKKASPFPPLPGAVGEDSIEVGIRFHSSEFR